ncbi:hypothetical protein GCM10008171_23470 [Methylopila jiangsuensis]|uniref:DUF3617 family protein n=1 Tax=Methylopila jiangsuensis TaxID=586230 RepID=A0A9W6JKA4_9HYPH|nr:DUF3617 family protein [Methylopila jiangsuensis]MDR6286567.1 hypothetical protein [Methylopila jiangsuensis]GLK77093.1 hypothetical protein GCM10008171_23470 [Methylopila jiangsuensis]
MRPVHVAAALAALVAPAFAAGFDLPPRTPGQWEMKVQVDTAAMPPQIIRMCLDAETDKLLNAKFAGTAQRLCSRQEQKTDGDAIVLESDCAVGDLKTFSRSVITGDFASAYVMRTDVQMEGSNAPDGVKRTTPAGPSSQQTTIEAKRVGECAAGFKPGDVDFGMGRITNLRDMPDPNIN